MSSPDRRTHRGLPNGVRGLFLAAVAAFGLGAATAAQEPDSLRLEVGSILRGIPADGLAPDGQEAQRLAGMPGALEVLFDVLSAGELPPAEGVRGGPEALGRARSETIVDAFRRAPSEVVRKQLREQATTASPVERRRAALRIYAAIGDAGDLVAVMRLCDEEGDAPALADELRTTFAGILARDPDASHSLSGIVRRVPAALAPALARAVGDAGSREGLLPLIVLAGLQPDLEATVLEEVQRVASRNDAPFPREVVDRTRRCLDSDDAAVAHAAIAALGSLEDAEAIDKLIEQLSSGTPAARSASRRALAQISRQSFTASADMWLAWWSAERTWYEEEAPGLLERLTSEDPLEVIVALKAIVPHHVFRHQLTPEIAGLVGHADPRVGGLACLALGQLGSAAAVPALESALADADTADQARVALLSIRSNEQPGS